MSKELSEIKELLEISIQQKSASDSDLKRDVFVIQEHLKGQDEKMDKILIQTTEHNHRMTKIEIWKANSKGWIAGFSIAATIIVSLVIYIFLFSTGQLEAKIDNHIIQTK